MTSIGNGERNQAAAIVTAGVACERRRWRARHQMIRPVTESSAG
jgi:hypothetical protein